MLVQEDAIGKDQVWARGEWWKWGERGRGVAVGGGVGGGGGGGGGGGDGAGLLTDQGTMVEVGVTIID